MSDRTTAGTGDDIGGLDFAEISRDDELVEALGLGLPVVAHTQDDFDLAELLAGWRTATLASPAPEPISVDDVSRAIAAETASRESSRKFRRHLRLVAGAAAIVGVALGGLAVLSEGANPNDPLWGVKKVVFKQQAVQTQAAFSAQANLEQAEKLLAAGNPQQAQEYVRRAQADLAPVTDQGSRASMDEWIGRLTASAESAIKRAAPATPPRTQARKAAPAPKPRTDNMPQYVPQVPQWTPAPQQQQAPEPRQAPEPAPQPRPRPERPRPPISILPN